MPNGEQEKEILELTRFNAERDITKQDKENIYFGLDYLHKNAHYYNEPLDWEEFAVNNMLTKILFPNEKSPNLKDHDYERINEVSETYFRKGFLGRHINLAVAQKILFPEKWSEEKKDFHSHDIIWTPLKENLESFNPSEDIDDLYTFFYFAQNMKILAPERFQELKLDEILGKNIWINDIEQELKKASSYYPNFALLASPIQIVGYPSKIEIDSLEWLEMEEEAQKLKEENDIFYFVEYSSRRNILAAKDIKITNESFDLIF